jgi:hypothetical protein
MRNAVAAAAFPLITAPASSFCNTRATVAHYLLLRPFTSFLLLHVQ